MVVLCVGLKLIFSTCMWDWLYPVVLWWLAKVTLHITYPMYITSCALHSLEHFICEKSHVLHAPARLLLTCHAAFTCLQDLVRSHSAFCIQIFFVILLIKFNHWITIYMLKPKRSCEVLTVNPWYILCLCNSLHLPGFEVQTSMVHVNKHQSNQYK